MEELKPKLLETNLKIKTAFGWLKEDAADDFYPDSFSLADLVN